MKCKVKSCNNSVYPYIDRARLYGIYGYCQIHTLERLRIKDLELKEKTK